MITGRKFGDPGPCPVDDCPHTTCVAPTPEPGAAIVVVQAPARDGVRTPRSAHVAPAGATPGTVSTSTYRRPGAPPRRRV